LVGDNWLGVDIGGANIKVADGRGYAESRPFPLWQRSAELEQELRTLFVETSSADRIVVAMTGELADCFPSKKAGVEFILGAVDNASDGRHTRVYLGNGKMVTPQAARAKPLRAAAANWRALAAFAGRCAPMAGGLLIDVGSTTTDIVPLMDGETIAQGGSDTTRMIAGELVYTGVERTPIASVIQTTPYRGETCPVASELFATTRDVYQLSGQLLEAPGDTRTADGRPATKVFARQRIGRMICADDGAFNHRDAAVICKAVQDRQIEMIVQAINQVEAKMSRPIQTVVVSGHGEFLARAAVNQAEPQAAIISLARELSPSVSRCATAHALAVLASEEVV